MYQFLTDLQQFNFLQYAVMTGIMASIACGIIGSYVTIRRMTYIAGAIAHCTLGGMGIAGYLSREQGLVFFTPLIGAVCAALLAALVIAWMLNYSTDTLITLSCMRLKRCMRRTPEGVTRPPRPEARSREAEPSRGGRKERDAPG